MTMTVLELQNMETPKDTKLHKTARKMLSKLFKRFSIKEGSVIMLLKSMLPPTHNFTMH